MAALVVATSPALARAEAASASAADGGRSALVAAAVVAWVLLLALVATQFLRQRRLARRLDELESKLVDRNRDDNGER